MQRAARRPKAVATARKPRNGQEHSGTEPWNCSHALTTAIQREATTLRRYASGRPVALGSGKALAKNCLATAAVSHDDPLESRPTRAKSQRLWAVLRTRRGKTGWTAAAWASWSSIPATWIARLRRIRSAKSTYDGIWPRHFAEAAFDKFGQGLHRRLGVGADRSQSECRTVSCPQRQQVEDAFAVDHLVSLENFDLALELAGQFHEQVRRAGVESLRIDDSFTDLLRGACRHDTNSIGSGSDERADTKIASGPRTRGDNRTEASCRLSPDLLGDELVVVRLFQQ